MSMVLSICVPSTLCVQSLVYACCISIALFTTCCMSQSTSCAYYAAVHCEAAALSVTMAPHQSSTSSGCLLGFNQCAQVHFEQFGIMSGSMVETLLDVVTALS